jgi:NTP pyrophosphatase (non-canonical NTP hydrolase)
MIDAEKMVKAVNKLDLVHRKGFRPSQIVNFIPEGDKLIEEANEVQQALEEYHYAYESPDDGSNEETLAHVLEEMGDVFAVLMQYAYRLGFTFEEVNQEAVRKMRLRFAEGDKVNLEDYS